jgi:zinc/manganese transport system substrate-binding protein
MRSDPCKPGGPAGLRAPVWCRAALCGLALAAGGAQAQTVFTCGPEWAALVRTLLPQARVHVATHAGQDPHHIDARPALIAQMRSADLAVCTGAELEVGWLPVLLQRAANPRVREVFYGAEHVQLLDERPGVVATPWSGDVHAHGNPHLHTDPRRLLQAADALAQWMAPVFPAQAAQIAARQAAFASTWQADITRWQQRAAPLRGQRVAVQHGTFAYLLDWLGLEVVADLEPRPGMPPTPGHLNRVRDSLRAAPPMAVVLASYQDLRPARWLHGQVPAVALVVLPATADERADAEGLRRWMDGLVDSLLAAQRARGGSAQGSAAGAAQQAAGPGSAAGTAGTAAAR